jgi:hypothetical protein
MVVIPGFFLITCLLFLVDVKLLVIRKRVQGKTALSVRRESGCKKRKHGAVCGHCAREPSASTTEA